MTSKLESAARAAMNNAYAPYSAFPVGAAILAKSGRIYAGCNVENASYPEGVCAETAAIAQMIAAGDTRIAELLVVAARAERVTPCGGCRQRLLEFADDQALLHLCDGEGVVSTLKLRDLLPLAFELDTAP